MPDVGSVKYQVELDDSTVDAQADKTDSKLTSKFGSIGKNMAKGLAVGTAAAGAAAVAAGKQVWDMAQDVAAAGDVIDKNSQKVGLSYEAYQKWDYAMNIAGTSMDSCTTGLKTLTNTFDDAKNGSAGAIEKFERLGLSMDDLSGLSREDMFATVVTALQNVEDESEKAALANDMFGKSGQDLIPLFNMTADELATVMAETEEYGMIMSDDAVKSSAAFQDSMTKLKGTMNGLKTGAIAALLPSLTDLVGGIADVANGTKEADVVIMEGLRTVLNNLQKSVPQFIERGMNLVIGLVNGIADNLPQFIEMGLKLINQFVQKIADNMPQIVDSGIKMVTALVKGLIQMAPTLAEAALKLIVALAKALISHIPEILDAGAEIISSLKEKFLSIDWGQLGLDIIKGIARGITGGVSWIINAAKDAARSALDAAKNWLGISSPSKKAAKEIGLPYVQGIAEGIDDNTDELETSAADAMSSLVPALPDISGLATDLGATISATASTSITVPLYLDGREIARGTAWYMNEQLAWEAR